MDKKDKKTGRDVSYISRKNKAIAKQMFQTEGISCTNLAEHFKFSYGAFYRLIKRESWVLTDAGRVKRLKREEAKRGDIVRRRYTEEDKYQQRVDSANRNLKGKILAQMKFRYEKEGALVRELVEEFSVTGYMIKKFRASGKWVRDEIALEKMKIAASYQQTQRKKIVDDPWPENERFDAPGMIVIFKKPVGYTSTV